MTGLPEQISRDGTLMRKQGEGWFPQAFADISGNYRLDSTAGSKLVWELAR